MSELSTIALLREDAELGAAIPSTERDQAERLVVVPCIAADVGPLEIAGEDLDTTLGLLVLDGLITVNVVIGDRVASLLAGPGDVVDVGPPPDALLPASISHVVSDATRVAVLDRRFVAAVRRWPGLMLTLHERLRDQERRLAVHAAIGKLRRIEDRILALLLHLGERWGRIAPEGVVIPLALTHETIGRLAGAERPTVSLALTVLSQSGDVSRREDGSFVLAHGSAERLRPARAPEQQLRPLAVRIATEHIDPDLPTPARRRITGGQGRREHTVALQDALPGGSDGGAG